MPSIAIDLDALLAFADNPLAAGWFLIANGGWVVLLIIYYKMARILWLNYIHTNALMRKWNPVLLAIDVPKRTIQTPKAAENIFSHLAGAHASANRREKYLTGHCQEWFSLEIASIEGYIQFYIWTFSKFRDLVETSIYAQYPDAQITEVEDYTTAAPSTFPNPEWDAWGTEFIPVKPHFYPIRTWEKFEHKGQKDEPFKDPLAALLENMARIGPGEQIWIQILIKPIGQEWQSAGMKVVKKLIGAKVKEQQTALGRGLAATEQVVSAVLTETIGSSPFTSEKKDEKVMPSMLLHMTKGEHEVIEGIEEKIAHIGFDTKIRMLYLGKKGVFKKARGAHPMIGAIKQFNTNDMNALKPEFKRVGIGSLWYRPQHRSNQRKTRLARWYQRRNMYPGTRAFILNTVELASLWHFPGESVHTPLIKKTAGKLAEPPAGLPTSAFVPSPPPRTGGAASAEPPPGLPIA